VYAGQALYIPPPVSLGAGDWTHGLIRLWTQFYSRS
jgi:hypothetical protein